MISKAAARLDDRRQHGEHVRKRQAFRADGRGRRAQVHEFLDARADEDKRDKDAADGQHRVVHSGGSADVGLRRIGSHGVHAHRSLRNKPALENARRRGPVPIKAPRVAAQFVHRACRAICTLRPRNLYTGADGITLWHVIRCARRGCRAGVAVLACVPRPFRARSSPRRFFMRNVGRKLAFVLAATNHGTMITNRFDYRIERTEFPRGDRRRLPGAGGRHLRPCRSRTCAAADRS